MTVSERISFVAVGLSALAVCISAASFYRSYVYRVDNLQVAPLWRVLGEDSISVGFALLNAGTREALVADAHPAVWLNNGVWVAISFGSKRFEPLTLKPGEIRQVTAAGRLETVSFLPDVPARMFGLVAHVASCRRVAIGLWTRTIDSSGRVFIHAEPLYQVLVDEQVPTLGQLQRYLAGGHPERAWADKPFQVFNEADVPPPDVTKQDFQPQPDDCK